MRNILNAAAVALVTTAVAGGANAMSVTTNTVLPAQITDASLTLDPTPISGAVRIDFIGNDLNNVSPNSRSPYDQTAFVGTALYHSVSGGASAEYTFGIDQRSFSLMWGSPDTYNTLEFFKDGLSQGSLTGSSVAPLPPLGTLFVNVKVDDILFDRVVFSSSQDAFEFTNVQTSPVPLPASVLLLGGALGGLGFLSRRRKAEIA